MANLQQYHMLFCMVKTRPNLHHFLQYYHGPDPGPDPRACSRTNAGPGLWSRSNSHYISGPGPDPRTSPGHTVVIYCYNPIFLPLLKTSYI